MPKTLLLSVAIACALTLFTLKSRSQALSVSFTTPAGPFCSGSAVPFTSTVTGGTAPYTYTWTFGGGGTSTDPNPTHSFTSLGTGTVGFVTTLTITDAAGASKSFTGNVTVLQAPDVGLTDQGSPFNPFNNCLNNPTPGSSNYTLTIGNISSNQASITSYTIDWGDGTVEPGLTNASFSRSHTYTQINAFNLVITGTGANGCSNSKTYTVANQGSPAGGLSRPGNDPTLCATANVKFLISNWPVNSPGTSFILDFGDGESRTLTYPLNATGVDQEVTHDYKVGSCPNGFTAKLTVSNGCPQQRFFTANTPPINIMPAAKFAATVLTSCTGKAVQFNDATIKGSYGSSCSNLTTYSWDFGDPASGANNTSALPSPDHTYATAGTYTVKLTTSNPCGTSSFTQQVCISDPPNPTFTLNKTSSCTSDQITVSNTTVPNTCGGTYNYQWTVTYAPGASCATGSNWNFAPGSTAASPSPSFVFNNPGIYTLKMTLTNPCGTYTTQQNVTVVGAPKVTLSDVTGPICQATTVNPTATVTNCGTGPLTYQWIIDGAPASTAADPGSISFSGVGQHSYAVSVANECPATTVTKTFAIGAVPDLTIPASTTLCGGQQTTAQTFTSTTPGAVITWTNNTPAIGLPATGSGNIQPFTTTNTTGAPLTATITVTASLNGCNEIKTFDITVNPTPLPPGVTSPVNYCTGDAASILTATVAPGATLIWDPVTNTPSTTTNGTFNFYVSQKDNTNGCESNRSLIAVIVSPIPTVTGSSSTDPTTCGSASGSIILTGLQPSTSFAVKYTKDQGTPTTTQITSTAAGILTIGSLTAGIYSNIIVGLANCTSPVLGPFTLSDPQRPAPPTASNVELCEGSDLTLHATSTPPGLTLNWSGPNTFTSTAQSPLIPKITLAATGAYQVIAIDKGCKSDPTPFSVTVDPRPIGPDIPPTTSTCFQNDLLLKASTTFAGPVTWSWTGPNGYTSTQQNPVINNSTTSLNGVYTVTITSQIGSCLSPPSQTLVTIMPVPHIADGSFVNPIGCNASNGAIILTGLQTSNTFTIQYTKDGGAPISGTYSSNPDGSLIISGLASGTYTNISATLGSCPSNLVGPYKLEDTPPFSVTIGSEGAICQGSPLQLNANVTSNGTAVYAWTGPGGFTSNLQNPRFPSATPAMSGEYIVTATINGCTAKKSVTIDVAAPTVGGNTGPDATACRSRNGGIIQLSGQTGNVIQWESSVNNGLSWQPILNTGSTLTYSNIKATTWYRALVQNGACAQLYSGKTIITALNSVDTAYITPMLTSTCNHDTTITYTATALYSGNDALSYTWYVDGQVAGHSDHLTQQFQSRLDNPKAEEFDIQIRVENTLGCGVSSGVAKTIINPLPIPLIDVSPSVVQKEPNFKFTFTDNAATSPTKLDVWDLGVFGEPQRNGKTIVYQYKEPGQYRVRLNVRDVATGCVAKDSVDVAIEAVAGSLIIPNAFYPNSAYPEVRTFQLKGIGLSKYHFQIFDAWGNLVFETTDLNPDGSPKIAWNGNQFNNGRTLPQGAYTWKMVEIQFVNNHGWIQLGNKRGMTGIVNLFR